MLHLEAPVFSLTRELTVFTIFIAVAIVAIAVIDRKFPKQGGQRVLPGEGELLPPMPLPPEPPLEDERLSDIRECHTIELFTKIEEYRNDFDDDLQAG